jgi:hypothetical protein
MKTDRHMTKLTVLFRNFVNTPKMSTATALLPHMLSWNICGKLYLMAPMLVHFSIKQVQAVKHNVFTADCPPQLHCDGTKHVKDLQKSTCTSAHLLTHTSRNSEHKIGQSTCLLHKWAEHSGRASNIRLLDGCIWIHPVCSFPFLS